MIFVDASALVAMVAREAEADSFADIVEAAAGAVTSPIAIFEAVLAIRRIRRSTILEASADVDGVLLAAGIEIVAVPPVAGPDALEAFGRFGKGTGHPAQLNMGDCFAYAVAKSHGAALLFKGDDFGHTDIRSAT